MMNIYRGFFKVLIQNSGSSDSSSDFLVCKIGSYVDQNIGKLMKVAVIFAKDLAIVIIIIWMPIKALR